MSLEELFDGDRARFAGKPPQVMLLCVLCQETPATLDDLVCSDCADNIKAALTSIDPPDSTTKIVVMEDWKAEHGRN